MFKRKNMLVAVAVSVLLAACGGGSDTPASSGGTTGNPAGGGGGAIAGTFAGTLNAFNNVLFGTSTDNVASLAQFAGDGYPNGVQFPHGTIAPIAQIGLQSTLSANDGVTTGTQNGRIAVSMVERAASVGAGEKAESLKVMVPVTYTIAGGNATVAPTTGGQAVIAFTDKAGVAKTATVDAAGLVKSVPVPGDTTAYLTVDLDAAMTKAGAAIGNVAAMTGSFDTDMTVSNIPVKAAAGGATLTGKTITVGTTDVSGGGISGAVQVDPI